MGRRRGARKGACIALFLAACQGGFASLGSSSPSQASGGANATGAVGNACDTHAAATDSHPATGANPTLGSNSNAPPPGDANGHPGEANGQAGGGTGGPSLCPATAAAGSACDGFEGVAKGAAPSAATWQISTVNPTSQVVVDDTRAARGTQALHLHTANGGYERAAIINTSIFPAGSNTFWGRAFFYIASPIPNTHFTLIAGANVPASASQQPTWVRYGGQFGHFIANYFGDDAAQHAAVNVNGQWTMATMVPADRWVCLEWQFKGDTNELHLYEDGAVIDRLSIVGTASDSPNTTWTAPTYGQVMVGWEIYGNSGSDASIPGYDIWLDEVALGPTRITCQK